MKKLIFGVGVVALVFAASLSFVSCNDDYVQDQLTELRSKVKADSTAITSIMEKRLQDLETVLTKKISDKESSLKEYIDKMDSKQDQHLADTLKKYVTGSELTQKLEDYVTLTMLQDSLESVRGMLNDSLASVRDMMNDLYALNKDRIDSNSKLIDSNSKRIDSDSMRIDSIFKKLLVYGTRIDALEAAISYDNDSNIVLSQKMKDAIKAAVETDIKLKADSIALEYYKKDSIYTDEKYQQALDSLNEYKKQATEVHDQIRQVTDSLHSVAMTKLQDLQGDLDDLLNNYNKFTAYCSEAISLLQYQIDDLSNAVDELNSWKDKMKSSYDTQITSLVLQGTYNSLFGSIRMPFGVNSMLLAGHYGVLDKEISFPSSSFYSGVKIEADPADTVYDNSGAGLVYLTVNPNTVDIKDVKFELVNSQDNSVGFGIDELVKYDEKLTFGWTRANNGLYAAPIYLTGNVNDVKVRIDFSDIKNVLKNALKNIMNLKMVDLSEIARVVYENSTDILDAAAIKATWKDGYGVDHSVYSGYDVAATMVKPLGFEFRGFDEYADKLVSKLNKFKLNTIDDVAFDFNIRLDSFNLDPMNQYTYPITITLDGSSTTLKGTADLKAFIDSLNASYVASTNDEVNYLIYQIKSQTKDEVNRAINKINTDYISKINNYISKFNNYYSKFVKKLDDIVFNDYLQPCILLADPNGHFGQVSSNKNLPTFVKKTTGSKVILTPTTYTSELLAPAMYKYLAVSNVYDKNGNVHTNAPAIMEACNKAEYNMNVPFSGKQQTVLDISASEDAIYEIVYEAVDYHGAHVTGKYYVYAY